MHRKKGWCDHNNPRTCSSENGTTNSQNAAEQTEASPASRSGAAAGSQEPVARPPQTGIAGPVSAGAENRRSGSPYMVADDSGASVRTDSSGTPRAGPNGGHRQLESLCRHTVERMRLDGAAEEQKQLQAAVPDEEPAPFQRLPDEMLLLVFSHLTPRDLCASVLPVCRQWHELGRDPVLWQHLSFNGYTCSTSTVVNILSYSTLLKTLTLDWWRCVDEILLQVADTCHQLRSLTVKLCDALNSPALEAVVKKCPLIERVDFGRFCYADCISALTGLQHLKALDVWFCGPQNVAALLQVVRHCTRLQELSVTGTYCLTDACVQELVAQAGSRLLSLQLDGAKLTDAGYKALGGCRKLQTLCIWPSHMMTDVSLPTLAGLHDLRRLQIRDGRQLSAAGLASLFAGQSMPLLMHLDLSECCNLDDATVDALTANCPQLTELNLSGMESQNSITNAGLELILTRLHCLRKLYLNGVPNITRQLIPRRLR